ncbi:MAG: hypothetical protein ABI543_03930 [Ignavibacteria bacterium]
MHKSLILFALIFIYIWGCAGGSDKYNLIDKDDRKAISSICKCMEPLTIYKEKMQNATDTASKRMYKDSFEVKVVELEPCLDNLDKLEIKFGDNKDYLDQFVEYVKDKHPKCVPIFLGIGNTDTVKNNK